MKKKGFTLIELLAVILILAIIAAIISPIVGNIIENAREQSAKRSAERYAAAAQEYFVESQLDFNKADSLGSNLIDKLELQNEDGTGYITAYSDGSVEMAIVINNICFTKTTTQDPKDIEVSKDVANCVVNSSRVRVSSVNSMENSIEITVDNSSNTDINISTCKYGTSRTDMNSDGSISGNVCTLSPTVSGTRYFYVITLSDGSQLNGTIQGGSGTSTYTGGGDHGGGAGNGGSGSGGSGNGGSGTGVAAPTLTEANGRTVYTGRMVSPVEIKYFNVTTGTKCDVVDFSANGGNTTNNIGSGCLKFFAYMEDDLSYTAILDRNINSNRYAWISSGNNGSGPVDAASALKSLTDSWLGTITPKNYINVYMANGSESAYRIAYETDGYHARFITSEEIAHITGNTTFSSVETGSTGWYYLDGGTAVSTGQTWQTQIATASEPSAYKWLFNYLTDCSGYGCSANGGYMQKGYWTSDAVAGTTGYAWFVGSNGAVNYGIGNKYGGFCGGFNGEAYCAGGNVVGITEGGMIGIRPVVTILKSTLN